MSLGTNIQFYRKQKNMTQEDLAEFMNVSRQTVSKWESDTAFPETDKLITLSDYFGCTLAVQKKTLRKMPQDMIRK